ncbi:MAG: TatD family nuclease-associated radical SAM protein [Eubacteriales bacterium]|nr:TatD family nuclease-associated radical SAM protein [Christensenellaceae bacterium]MDY2751680.1 TatD family nuclease-associated radical SAM protein [Eubacteriales bacterium]MCI7583264.1 TatD family nuclease-associated radical SAM protein [Christensenellaceae bacterium]MCI7769298.1 TatD family nuclease-associated radical SAM protein [Christensenellaceae bacterium]MDD6361019.1 TatD family nuclease-associated radical SAM protein [Christensenellaceae bacterium]
MNTITYVYGDKIYLNLTNKCSNNCEFCIRRNNDGLLDYYLWLDKEPTADEVIADLEKYELDKYDEAVFCGFGEPLYAIDVLIETADWLKAHGVKTRLNTNGQAGLISGPDTALKLKGRIDTVSISLNASDAEKYQKICHCKFNEEGFFEMLRFAVQCKKEGIRTVLSVVDVIGEEEVEKCRKVAKNVGVDFRVRTYVPHYDE